MSYPSWPGTLPQIPLADGYTESLADNVIRSENDAGPAKMRRRSTVTNETLVCTMHITKSQWATVRTFYLTTLAAVLPFTWVQPSTGAAANFRFLSPPTITPAGGLYVTLTLNLEVVP